MTTTFLPSSISGAYDMDDTTRTSECGWFFERRTRLWDSVNTVHHTPWVVLSKTLLCRILTTNGSSWLHNKFREGVLHRIRKHRPGYGSVL